MIKITCDDDMIVEEEYKHNNKIETNKIEDLIMTFSDDKADEEEGTIMGNEDSVACPYDDNDVNEDIIEEMVEKLMTKQENEFGGGAVQIPKSLKELMNSEYWIGNTGAATHFTSSITGMINTRVPDMKEIVIMGNGSSADSAMIGDIVGTIYDKNGDEVTPVILTEATYSKDAKFNLFSSITFMLKKGWKMSANSNEIVLMKEKMALEFDVKVPTPNGVLYCLRLKRTVNKETALIQVREQVDSARSLSKVVGKDRVSIHKAHALFGHMDAGN